MTIYVTRIDLSAAFGTIHRDTPLGAPQEDSYIGPRYELHFKNSYRKFRRETEITNQKDLTEVMIHDDDYANLAKDLEKKEKSIEKLRDVLKKRII